MLECPMCRSEEVRWAGPLGRVPYAECRACGWVYGVYGGDAPDGDDVDYQRPEDHSADGAGVI